MAIVIPSKYIFSPKHQNAVGNNINGIEYSVYTEPRYENSTGTPITIDFYENTSDGVKFVGNKKIDYVSRRYAIYDRYTGEVIVDGDFLSDDTTYLKTADGEFKPLTKTGYTVEVDAEGNPNPRKIYLPDKYLNFNKAGAIQDLYIAQCAISINFPTGFEYDAQKMNLNLRKYISYRSGDIHYADDNYQAVETTPTEIFTLQNYVVDIYNFDELGTDILKYIDFNYDLFSYNFGTSTYQSTETAPFKFDENILFHSANMYDGKPFMENLSSKILNKYQNGTEMIELSCIVGNYYDENGEKVISIDNDNLPMIFKNGDIVKPMRKSISGDAPISENENGESNLFQVISVGFEYNGAIYQKLVLQQTQ